MKTEIALALILSAIITILLIGEIRCISKAISCNWDPIGKAEIVYTGASLTGFGCVVGYIDIQDK